MYYEPTLSLSPCYAHLYCVSIFGASQYFTTLLLEVQNAGLGGLCEEGRFVTGSIQTVCLLGECGLNVIILLGDLLRIEQIVIM